MDGSHSATTGHPEQFEATAEDTPTLHSPMFARRRSARLAATFMHRAYGSCRSTFSLCGLAHASCLLALGARRPISWGRSSSGHQSLDHICRALEPWTEARSRRTEPAPQPELIRATDSGPREIRAHKAMWPTSCRRSALPHSASRRRGSCARGTRVRRELRAVTFTRTARGRRFRLVGRLPAGAEK